MRPMLKALMGVLVAASVAAAGGGVALAAGPALTLKPSSGPPSTRVAVAGSGFGVNEGVDVYFDSTDLVLASTSSTGAFSVTLTVPASAQPGSHYITGVGRSSGLSAQRVFTVRTNWSQLGFGAARLGSNSYENTLSPYNVAGLDQAWSFGTGAAVDSTPAVVNGILYAGSEDGHVYALKASSGAIKWNDDLSILEPSGFDSSPVVAGGFVYIGGNSGNVYALNAATGFSQWVFPTGGPVLSSPTVVNGIVYVGSEDQVMYALNATTGAQVWDVGTTGGISSSPAVVNGTVYFGSQNGNVYALNAATGALVWYFSTGGGVYSAPAVASGTVYVGSHDGNLYALNALNGLELWSYGTGGSAWSPAVAGGVVYIGSGSLYTLEAVNATTGAPIWSTGLNGGVIAKPTVANGVVYESAGIFASSGGNDTLAALDAYSGAVLWTASNGNWSQTSLPVVNGWVYAGSTDDSIYAYRLPVRSTAAQRPAVRSLHPDYGLRPA